MTEQPVSRALIAQPEETILQQGKVTVTTSRLLIGSKTYAMSDITSATFGKTAPYRPLGVILVVAGVLGGLFGVTVATMMVNFMAILFTVVCGAAIVVLGVFMFALGEPRHTVRLGSPSGVTGVLSSNKEEWIRKIVNAINEAIIRRG